MRRLFDWLDARVGFRGGRSVMLDEPLPPGTGWFFTLGSVLLALLAIQILTGAFLTLYYAATPDHAYDSVRFIAEQVTAGRLVRGLHHYGASFLIVVLALHLLRVVLFGSYRPPREVTWLSGIALLLLVLGFALTGYLLPWDQRAYWATVVSINIGRLAPAGGEFVASVLRGGATVGALTLTRWYALHVVFLPALLVLLVVLHLLLMRRQGISGPVRTRPGDPYPFFPRQAARDTAVILLVTVALGAFAWHGAPALEAPADPTDATYIPRPEWYFLGLFQLLKYFPARAEVFGAVTLPTIGLLLLAALPWIDRGRSRAPKDRPIVMAAIVVGALAVVSLTALGWRDRPESSSPTAWPVRAIGGRQVVLRANCTKCHAEGDVADPLEATAITRSAEWIGGHVSDPEMIAPGLREPPTLRSDREIAAMVSYVRQLARGPYPGFPPQAEQTAGIIARYCIGCHKFDGDGGTDGPDLTHAGRKHDADWFRRWITSPKNVDPKAEMPAFGKRVAPADIDALAQYLVARR